MKLTTKTTFTPSVSETINPPAGNVGMNATFALPAVDPANVAMTVQNLCGSALIFAVGTASILPSGPTVAGCYRVETAQTLLLETEAGAATFIGACTGAPGSFIVTRGSVATATVFE
jgi:hypothetical protein